METVNEHAILVQCSDMNDSLMLVFFYSLRLLTRNVTALDMQLAQLDAGN